MFANLTRTEKVPNATSQNIFAGDYIEAAVSSIFFFTF